MPFCAATCLVALFSKEKVLGQTEVLLLPFHPEILSAAAVWEGCMVAAAVGPADLLLPADGAVCGALGQRFTVWGEMLGLGKVQALVGLLSLEKGYKSERV